MIRSLVLVCVMLGLVPVVAGCTNTASCESLCREAEDRGCNTFSLGTGSCESDCALAHRLSDKGGCNAQYDARVDCEARQADICEVGCGSEENALESCVQTYCLAHLSDPDCTGGGL